MLVCVCVCGMCECVCVCDCVAVCVSVWMCGCVCECECECVCVYGCVCVCMAVCVCVVVCVSVCVWMCGCVCECVCLCVCVCVCLYFFKQVLLFRLLGDQLFRILYYLSFFNSAKCDRNIFSYFSMYSLRKKRRVKDSRTSSNDRIAVADTRQLANAMLWWPPFTFCLCRFLPEY